MKIHPPKNGEYAATVVQVKHIVTLDNCDNVVAVPLLGYQAITGKDVQIGDLGILFTAETQLSQEFAAENNLHRHENLNTDPAKKGYLEDNRRVKALRFRGHRSDALFMPLSCLNYLNIDTSKLAEGDTFDELDGHDICQKYVIPGKRNTVGGGSKAARKERLSEKMLPKHFDTPNYFRFTTNFSRDQHITVTQKLHGTSVRIGHTLVERKLSWWQKVGKKIGFDVQEKEWAYVYGSRNVIKDPDNPFLPSEFYGTDIYSEVGSQLNGLLPKGFVVYGEIVGWVPGTNTPIQKGYTYQIAEGCARLYVYRITTINEDGFTVDLSWDAVREFCATIGVRTVPQLAYITGIYERWVEDFLDVRFDDTADMWLQPPVPTEPGTVDEGICLRVEGVRPTIMKAKSPIFLQHETKMLDKGEADLESEG